MMKLPNWRRDDNDDGDDYDACSALNHYTIDQLGQPCCIWLQWAVNWRRVRMRMRMRKLTAIAFAHWLSLGQSVARCCLSGQQLSGCLFRALNSPLSTQPVLLYQRRVANLLTGTQNVIKCFADCALLSHNNNNNYECVYRIIKCNWQTAVLRNTLQRKQI